MPGAGKGDAFVQLKMPLGADEIHLCSASGEGAIHHDLLRRRYAGGGLALVAHQQLELIQQCGSQNRLLHVSDLLFAVLEEGGGRSEGGAANAVIPDGFVPRGGPDRKWV